MINNVGKIAATVAVVTFASLGLGACGATDKGKTNSSTSNGKVIQYLHRLPDADGMVKVDEIVKKWNSQHPDIQVKATKFDGKADEMAKKLETDIKANNGPCLAQVGYGEIPEMYTKNMLEDVTKEAAKYKDKFAEGPFNLATVDNKTVGLPQDSGPMVYYYNKAEFAKLGINVPTTIADFKAAAKKAAEKGKYIADFQPDEVGSWLSAQSAAAGGHWYKIENGKWQVKVDDVAAKTVVDFWQSMLDAKSVLTNNRWDDSFKKALNDQKLIGTIGASWEAPLLADDMKDSANKGQWAVAQLPDFGNGVKTGPDGGSAIAVMKGCSRAPEAMKFAAWFNTQIDSLVSQGLVTAAKGEAKTPETVKSFYGGQEVWAELGKANTSMVSDFNYMPGYSQVSEAMKTVAADAATGKAKVADVIKKAQDTSVSGLEEQKLPVAK